MPARSLFLLALLIIFFSMLVPAAGAQSTYILFLPLVARQLPTPSEQEPNDSRAQANGPLESGVIYYGLYDTDQDSYDIFFFESEHTGPVRVTLTNHPISILQLQLHTAASVLPLRYVYLAPYQIDYTLNQIGRYYIVIYVPQGSPSNQFYQLTVTYP